MRKKPMLAYPVSTKPIDYSKPTFIQPKLDGVRCLIQYENRPIETDDLSGQLTENVVVAYSRTGKEWKNINHILENKQHGILRLLWMIFITILSKDLKEKLKRKILNLNY